MYSQTWIMSMIALLVMDVRTGALEQDIQARRCYQCSPTNGTSCEQAQGWLTATCPSARPYCATVATAPDFATTLGCAAAVDGACSLSRPPRQTLELTCICVGQLCNAPFSAKLRTDLLNFSSPIANDSSLTEAFLKLSNFANISESALYKAITVDAAAIMLARNSSEVSTSSSVGASEVTLRSEAMPRAEPLKQQATVPSEDDEDESEGSGTYEDARSHIQSNPGSAPAAPSSYLPAEENKAVHHLSNLLLPSLLFYIVV